jgi:hypothetical protein
MGINAAAPWSVDAHLRCRTAIYVVHLRCCTMINSSAAGACELPTPSIMHLMRTRPCRTAAIEATAGPDSEANNDSMACCAPGAVAAAVQ